MQLILGAHPGNLCTGNAFYGCQRQGTATNYVNVIQSARMRTAETFAFKYGRIEVRAQTPRGDWIWPGKGDCCYHCQRNVLSFESLFPELVFTVVAAYGLNLQ